MYWKTWAAALLLAAWTAAGPSAAATGPLRILGSDAVPLFFVRDGVITGFCAEIVKEIQRRIGDRTPIQVVPWVRAYRTALSGERSAVQVGRPADGDPHPLVRAAQCQLAPANAGRCAHAGRHPAAARILFL